MKRRDRLIVDQTYKFNGKRNRKHFLKHLILENNYTSMTEVGVRDGRTTFFLLDHIPQLTIYAVDNNISLFYNESIKQKYGSRLIPIEGDSSQVADKTPMVDLVFIDADGNNMAPIPLSGLGVDAGKQIAAQLQLKAQRYFDK
mgnify:CR=1 FL=1